MTESKKPQQEFTPWGLQNLPERTLRDMAVGGLGAVKVERVPRADGGEDIVMKHVDIRHGILGLTTEEMDRLVQEECRPRSYDAELERARQNVERFAQLDNTEHAYEDYCERSARITAREEAKHGASVTGALLGISMILLGLLAFMALGFGTYGLIHMVIERAF